MSTTIVIPTLRTPRLTLRAYRASDWDALSALNADPDFREFLGGGTLLSRKQTWAGMEAALGQWALRGYGLFAVEMDGRFAGRVGILHPAGWPAPELAWGVAPAAWGQGIAGEAAAAVRNWAVRECGLSRLVSFIVAENRKSQRVAEKLGCVRDGTTDVRRFVAEIWVHPTPGGGVVV